MKLTPLRPIMFILFTLRIFILALLIPILFIPSCIFILFLLSTGKNLDQMEKILIKFSCYIDKSISAFTILTLKEEEPTNPCLDIDIPDNNLAYRENQK